MRPASILLAIAIAAALLGSACDAINQPSELERAIAAEQKIIERYSEQVKTVDGLQKAFVEAWREANEIVDLKAYEEALSARVLPAFERYLTAVKAMPTESEELARIHALMVEPYEAAYAAFVKFHAELDKDTVESGYKDVLAAMDAVKAAEKTYLDQLESYYDRNRVNLVPAEPSAP